MNTERNVRDKKAEMKAAYDRVFSDETIVEEQLAMAMEFKSYGGDEGQEW